MIITKQTLAAAIVSLPMIASGSVAGGTAFAAQADQVAAAASLSLRVLETPVMVGRPRATSSFNVKMPVKPVGRVRIGPRF